MRKFVILLCVTLLAVTFGNASEDYCEKKKRNKGKVRCQLRGIRQNLEIQTSNTASITTVLEAQSSIIENITSVLDTQYSMIESLTNALETQSRNIANITSALDTQSTKIESITSTLETQASLTASTTNALETQSATIESLTSALEIQSGNIENITNAMETQSNKIESITTTLETQSGLIENTTNALETQSSTIESITNAVETQSGNIENITNAIGTQSSQIESITSTLETQSSLIQNTKTSLEAAIQELSVKVTGETLQCETSATFDISYEKHCYYLSANEVDYDTAKSDCETNGGYLVKLSDNAEFTYFQNYLRSNDTWIGLDDIAVEGTFVWQYDNSVHNKIDSWWHTGQPDDFFGEDCVHYWYSDSKMLLNDDGCTDNTFKYLCEKDL